MSIRTKPGPTGSGRAATCSRPAAMASIRSGFRARRSRKAGARPSAAARSAALAARIAGVAARSAAAAAWRAASFAGRGARARSMAAARAARAAASNWRATASAWAFTAAGPLPPAVLSPAGGGGKAGGPRRARAVRRYPRFCSARTNAEGTGREGARRGRSPEMGSVWRPVASCLIRTDASGRGSRGCAPWTFFGDGDGLAAGGVLPHSDKCGGRGSRGCAPGRSSEMGTAWRPVAFAHPDKRGGRRLVHGRRGPERRRPAGTLRSQGAVSRLPPFCGVRTKGMDP